MAIQTIQLLGMDAYTRLGARCSGRCAAPPGGASACRCPCPCPPPPPPGGRRLSEPRRKRRRLPPPLSHANIEQEANADHHDAASSSHAQGEGVNEEGSRLETQIEGAVQRGLSELLFEDGDDDDDDGQEEEEGLIN